MNKKGAGTWGAVLGIVLALLAVVAALFVAGAFKDLGTAIGSFFDSESLSEQETPSSTTTQNKVHEGVIEGLGSFLQVHQDCSSTSQTDCICGSFSLNSIPENHRLVVSSSSPNNGEVSFLNKDALLQRRDTDPSIGKVVLDTRFNNRAQLSWNSLGSLELPETSGFSLSDTIYFIALERNKIGIFQKERGNSDGEERQRLFQHVPFCGEDGETASPAVILDYNSLGSINPSIANFGSPRKLISHLESQLQENGARVFVSYPEELPEDQEDRIDRRKTMVDFVTQHYDSNSDGKISEDIALVSVRMRISSEEKTDSITVSYVNEDAETLGLSIFEELLELNGAVKDRIITDTIDEIVLFDVDVQNSVIEPDQNPNKPEFFACLQSRSYQELCSERNTLPAVFIDIVDYEDQDSHFLLLDTERTLAQKIYEGIDGYLDDLNE